MEIGVAVRIIFSRKGFDSSSGGKPSPILPDGRMVSLPIPDKQSPIRYGDIRWHEHNLGALVSDLTDGRIPASHLAHLDPDLSNDSLPRLPGWRPIFGQTGAAQGHLRNTGVVAGDIFLFFGLFRHVAYKSGKLDWNTCSPPLHVLWGWLQIDEVLKVDGCDDEEYKWAKYHPHFHRGFETNNTVYVARKHLTLPGVSAGELAGAGVFPCFSEQLRLTALSATTPSLWELPQWLYPRNDISPLTYHADLSRWQKSERGTKLNTVARGQEFILDCADYPDSIEWINTLLESNSVNEGCRNNAR